MRYNISMNIQHIKATIKSRLPELLQKYGVESLGVFGSYIRREQKSSSDLDILVTFKKTPGLLKFIELENYLSDLFGVKVDLVMKDVLKPAIGRHILNEVIYI